MVYLANCPVEVFDHYLQGSGYADGPLRSNFVTVVGSLTYTGNVSWHVQGPSN